MSDDQPTEIPDPSENVPVIDGDTDGAGYEPNRHAGGFELTDAEVMAWGIHDDHKDDYTPERDFGEDD